MPIDKRRFTHFILALLFVAAVSALFACAPEDPARVAGQVAREWTTKNVDSISKGIAGQVSGSNPFLETTVGAVISNQIRQKISWQYSVPDRLAEDRYGVVATASTQVEIPVLGNYLVSLNYNLQIDTRNRQVISANIDPASFAMSKL